MARAAGERIDRRQRVADVVVDVERLQVVRRRNVLRQRADRKVRDHLVRARVDHVHRVTGAVGDVDPRRIPPRHRADHPGVVVCVQVEPAGTSKPAPDDLRLLVAADWLWARLGGRIAALMPVPDDDPDLRGDESDTEQKGDADSAGSPFSSRSHRAP